jgi:glycerate 2-kinase
MKIVLAPDSFKGSLTAREVCEAMETGIRRVLPDANVVQVPMADGGEGTMQSLVDATNSQSRTVKVNGPLGETVEAHYGILGDGQTAVIEMAEASGLILVPADKRDPLVTTTYGTGELIRSALDEGCRTFILAIGGSATNDGGAGMAQALGARLLDAAGEPIAFGGGALQQLQRVDVSQLDPRLADCSFTIASDVDNPLCGVSGASHVFGPQKGATPEVVLQLDRNLEHFASVLERDLGKQVKDLPGAGAAGGLGAGAVAFLHAVLQPGVDIVMEAAHLADNVQDADLVLSGEGQCDFQTAHGKTPFGVAKVAKQAGVPVILLAGSIGQGVEALYPHGVKSVFSIVDRPMSLEQAFANGADLVANATERVIRLLV